MTDLDVKPILLNLDQKESKNVLDTGLASTD